MKKRRSNVLNLVFILIGTLVYTLLNYVLYSFDCVTIEQILYSAINSEGTSSTVIVGGLLYVVPRVIIYTLAVIAVLYIFRFTLKNKFELYFSFKNKEHKIDLFTFSKKRVRLFSIFYMVGIILYSLYSIGLIEYAFSQLNKSNIFENEYVNPKDVTVTFPEKKQNLIYIFYESLETGDLSITNGGTFSNSISPNMEQLGLEYINFSNTDKLGGFYRADGTGWTIAGMVGQTAGIPLKLSIDGNSYGGYSSFLQGAYTLGEILEKNGYKNYLAQGSTAEFAGKDSYFKEHGNYTIYDNSVMKEEKFVPEDYYVWWGVEDSKTFEYSKQKLLEISKNNEPFNFTILTNNTHFTDGYFEDGCESPFDLKYSNSYYCADKITYDFIKWVQSQSFYKDTVIVIAGDHPTMQAKFIPKDYDRTVYNIFINSKIEASNYHNRIFTSFDMYPTIIASLGAKIDGDRLALGTNLFSNEPTLAEKMGFQDFNKQISKKSFFYDNYLVGDSYYEMKETWN